jgi:uncharacterized damage-inducible protein DinB
MSDPRYPIGRFEMPASVTAAEREAMIGTIAAAPARLREAVSDLSESQLDTPYREGGWTVRQVVHHLPDSHLNGYIRFKLGLTEENPPVRGYEEARWAELPEARGAAIEMSLRLLDSLHERWAESLRSTAPEQFARTFRHPDRGAMTLDQHLVLYAWHSRHHVAHITGLRRRMGW